MATKSVSKTHEEPAVQAGAMLRPWVFCGMVTPYLGALRRASSAGWMSSHSPGIRAL
jgi:hypothetical protein